MLASGVMILEEKDDLVADKQARADVVRTAVVMAVTVDVIAIAEDSTCVPVLIHSFSLRASKRH